MAVEKGWRTELADTTPAPTGSLATALAHATRLLARDPQLAEAQAREIIAVFPRDAEALPILARALVAQGRIADAIHTLQRATEFHPRAAHVWRELGDLRFQIGDYEGADAAYAQHVLASVNDPRLIEAAKALCANKLAVAEQKLREFLKEHPTDVAAIRMLAEAGARLGRYEDAENLLVRALELAPGFRVARQNYATILYRQNKAAEAIAQTDLLLKDDPRNAGVRALKAAALGQIGEYAEAVANYETLLAGQPAQPKAWMSYGHSLKALGRQQDCITAYRRSIALSPQLGEAWWSLANLKTLRFSAEDISQMRTQLVRENLGAEDRWHLHFALGKALEDECNYAESFAHYRDGNRLRREALDYDADDISDHVARSCAFFTREFFAARSRLGCTAPDPIFVVGLPRSGSTLVEQILASHSAVEGTMELPDIASLARRLGGKMKRSDSSAYPEVLADLDATAFENLGEEFLSRTRIHRRLRRLFFIDKMPNNFAHAGMIHLILPNAKIIDVRRHPLACCFSLFKQHFARGQGFSYDLLDIGRYYLDYARLMSHFDAVLPGRIHRVFHEQLVMSPEEEVRKLLDHCGLGFEDNCLHFHANPRPVRTASSEQVRRPLSADGIEHWRHYEEWLELLKPLLAPVLANYPDPPVFRE
ncbi:MAG TPA: sulfotransferase [Rhizomicrobium sp.]|jgi:tetratricopeptide (TPR) repeat protein|nr:sulfotransferase [Rhizomicrobium sp.]